MGPPERHVEVRVRPVAHGGLDPFRFPHRHVRRDVERVGRGLPQIEADLAKESEDSQVFLRVVENGGVIARPPVRRDHPLDEGRNIVRRSRDDDVPKIAERSGNAAIEHLHVRRVPPLDARLDGGPRIALVLETERELLRGFIDFSVDENGVILERHGLRGVCGKVLGEPVEGHGRDPDRGAPADVERDTDGFLAAVRSELYFDPGVRVPAAREVELNAPHVVLGGLGEKDRLLRLKESGGERESQAVLDLRCRLVVEASHLHRRHRPTLVRRSAPDAVRSREIREQNGRQDHHTPNG